MTQPLYDEAQVEAMLVESRRRFGARGFPVPVLLGVLPLVSARHAEFLHNEVPGITIPDATRARMRDAGAAGTEAGIEMADALLGGRRGRGRRHLPDAELRALRAGRRARPADPRAPPGRDGGRLLTPRARVSFGHAPARIARRFPVAPAIRRPLGRRRARPGRRRARRRGRSAVPAAGRRPGGLRHRRRPPRRDGAAGRGDDRRDRAADRRRGRRLHAADAVLRGHRRRPSTTPRP